MKKRFFFITLIGINFGIKAQTISESNGNIVGFNRIVTGLNDWMDIQLNGTGSSFKIHDNTNGENWVKWTAGSNYTQFLKSIVISDGSLGIGTTNTSFAKLQIRGGHTHHLFAVSRPNSDTPSLYIGNNGTNVAAIASNNSDLTFGRDLSGVYSEYIRVQNGTGNVGIGTLSTGSHKLAVEGSIGAREIKVQANGWSDFVFKKEYNLPTLKEVENHIIKKGHLKDIPSAKEVEENGIYLGEMDSRLLQKIEELTLYTISQEKQLKTQNSKIQKLEKENKSLKKINLKLLELQNRLEKLEKK